MQVLFKETISRRADIFWNLHTFCERSVVLAREPDLLVFFPTQTCFENFLVLFKRITGYTPNYEVQHL